eukprot:917066-Pelagomonas_calceolata.AAC.1
MVPQSSIRRTQNSTYSDKTFLIPTFNPKGKRDGKGRATQAVYTSSGIFRKGRPPPPLGLKLKKPFTQKVLLAAAHLGSCLIRQLASLLFCNTRNALAWQTNYGLRESSPLIKGRAKATKLLEEKTT